MPDTVADNELSWAENFDDGVHDGDVCDFFGTPYRTHIPKLTEYQRRQRAEWFRAMRNKESSNAGKA
jgi:hypothetical protein